MILFRRLLSGVYRLFHATQTEQELDEEVRAYLETAVEEKMAAGLTPEEARRGARLEIGSLAAVKDRARDVGWEASLDTLWRDTGIACRRLRRSPGFSVAAILTLALGIGGNTAIFSVLRATSLAASAYRDPDRVAMVWSTPAGRPEVTQGTRVPEYLAWRARTHAFEQIGATLGWASTLGAMRDGEPAERLNGWRFAASTFPALGLQPSRGRFFTDEEDRIDGPTDVMVISYSFWQGRLGGDPGVVGRTLLLDGTTTTIVGVMPANFRFFDGAQGDFWIPMSPTRFQAQSRQPNGVLTVVGRLKPGLSVAEGQADLEGVAAQYAAEAGEPQKNRGLRVQPFDDALMGSVRRLLRVLQGAIGFVLLIACANVAGLLLVRAATQHKEVAIRSSLGASRGRIVRQFLTESLVLALIGGTLGVFLASVGLRVLVATSPSWLSAVQNIRIDGGVLLFSTVVSVVIGVTFGLVPALQVSATDLVTRLKEAAGPSLGSPGHRRIQGVLVAGQVALTLMLLVGAGLLIKSYWQLQHADLGYQSKGVLSFQSRLPANKYFKQVSSRNGITLLDVSPVPAMLFDRVAERLRQLPGIESVGGTNAPPMFGIGQAPFMIEGRSGVDATGSGQGTAGYALVTPNYFGTMRIPVLRGRDFSASDVTTTLPVAIVNQAMARQFWPNEDLIGKRVTVAIVPGLPVREVVAVVGDTPTNRFAGTPAPMLYVPQLQESVRSRIPFGQSRVQMTFLLRLTQPLDVVMPALRRAVAEVDPGLPVSQVEMVDDYLAQEVEVPRHSMLLVGAFGAMALLLAIFGIYGVVAYGVVQRTREIGIRMSLGARRSQVLALVLRQTAVVTAAGMVLGLIGASVLSRLLRSLIFGLTPLDLATFVTVSVVFVTVAALASYVPAWRATRVDPLVALRYE